MKVGLGVPTILMLIFASFNILFFPHKLDENFNEIDWDQFIKSIERILNIFASIFVLLINFIGA